jgi:hypothetical protein
MSFVLKLNNFNWEYSVFTPQNRNKIYMWMNSNRWDLRSSKKTAWPFKMGPSLCPETSVKDYLSTLHNTPEEYRFHQHRGRSLKSRTVTVFQICLAVLLLYSAQFRKLLIRVYIIKVWLKSEYFNVRFWGIILRRNNFLFSKLLYIDA